MNKQFTELIGNNNNFDSYVIYYENKKIDLNNNVIGFEKIKKI